MVDKRMVTWNKLKSDSTLLGDVWMDYITFSKRTFEKANLVKNTFALIADNKKIDYTDKQCLWLRDRLQNLYEKENSDAKLLYIFSIINMVISACVAPTETEQNLIFAQAENMVLKMELHNQNQKEK